MQFVATLGSLYKIFSCTISITENYTCSTQNKKYHCFYTNQAHLVKLAENRSYMPGYSAYCKYCGLLILLHALAICIVYKGYFFKRKEI